MSVWKRIFDENRVIPPPNQTSRLAQGPSQAFQLLFKRLDKLHLNQAEELRSERYELRVSLFDNNLHRFFGRTWKSKPHQATKRNQEQPCKVHFNEVVYFHTSLCLASVVAVVELASLSHGTDTSQNAVGQGFGILQLFSEQAQGEGSRPGLSSWIQINVEFVPWYSSSSATPNTEGPTSDGTCQGLGYFRQHVNVNAVLSVIEGTQLLYSLQPHPALNPIMHLLPPNIMVSGRELIPGVLPPTDSTGDALQRPRLMPAFSCMLERVCVSLSPSVQAFEADLLERLNNDRNNTHGYVLNIAVKEEEDEERGGEREEGEEMKEEEEKKKEAMKEMKKEKKRRKYMRKRSYITRSEERAIRPLPHTGAHRHPRLIMKCKQRMGAEVRLVVVQERRLHVGVHNGLGWVDGPQVMVLEPSSGGSGGLKESSTETYSLFCFKFCFISSRWMSARQKCHEMYCSHVCFQAEKYSMLPRMLSLEHSFIFSNRHEAGNTPWMGNEIITDQQEQY
ncbi:hypothetical protein QTP70_029590 [Hemibagrus guttatus]|uniref:Uncharacterized protein n=1 Tax=Hemibagrus guttatus TaxID=175788 RepID=A0AAE0R4A5_9TELE|nr:hypothetical protein QTP70_029590 [Hemibagrus guttatus]